MAGSGDTDFGQCQSSEAKHQWMMCSGFQTTFQTSSSGAFIIVETVRRVVIKRKVLDWLFYFFLKIQYSYFLLFLSFQYGANRIIHAKSFAIIQDVPFFLIPSKHIFWNSHISFALSAWSSPSEKQYEQYFGFSLVSQAGSFESGIRQHSQDEEEVVIGKNELDLKIF